MPPGDDEPFVVTTAAQSPVEERDNRQRRYLITMAVRVVAFVAAIFLARWSWWLAAIAIAASLLLPWFAVVAANAPVRGGHNGKSPTLYDGEQPKELREG